MSRSGGGRSERRLVITLISALYLSSPTIALEFCLDKGSARQSVCVCVRFSSPLSTPGHTELQHKGGHRQNNHRPGKRLLSGTKESARSFAGFSANTHKQHSFLRGAFYTHLTQKGAQREFWCGGLRRPSQNHFGRGTFDERSVLNPFKQICFNEEMNLSLIAKIVNL